MTTEANTGVDAGALPLTGRELAAAQEFVDLAIVETAVDAVAGDRPLTFLATSLDLMELERLFWLTTARRRLSMWENGSDAPLDRRAVDALRESAGAAATAVAGNQGSDSDWATKQARMAVLGRRVVAALEEESAA